MRDSLACLVRSVAIEAETFASGEQFFSHRDPARSACLILDLRMPGQGGLEVQDSLVKDEQPIPVIFISGHGDIPTAVRAMKGGAVEFLTKPFSEEVLLRCVRRALKSDQLRRRDLLESSSVRARLEQLTAREAQVLEQVVHGASNKETARTLGISPKTVELHRANLMRKMHASSLADLVQKYLRVQAVSTASSEPSHPGPDRG